MSLTDKNITEEARKLAERANGMIERMKTPMGEKVEETESRHMLGELRRTVLSLATHYDTIQKGFLDKTKGDASNAIPLMRKDAPEATKAKYEKSEGITGPVNLDADEALLTLCGLHLIQHMAPEFFDKAQKIRDHIGEVIPRKGYTEVEGQTLEFADYILDCGTIEKFITMTALGRVLSHGMQPMVEEPGDDEQAVAEA